MNLVPRFVLGSLDLTDYPFLVEFGSELGNAENVVDILGSLLVDGEIESLSRRSNRTLVIPILIEGTDLDALAAAEASLIAECDKLQNTLSIDPGDGYGAVTVFDTFAAQPERVYDDEFEKSFYRRWRLTIKALPYAHSEIETVDDAGTPPSGGGTLLYNCESTTGWSSYNTVTAGSFAVDTTIFTEGTGSLRSLMITPSWDQGFGSHFASGTSYDEVTGLSLSTATGGYLTVAVRLQYEDNISGATPGLLAAAMQVGGVWIDAPTPIPVNRDVKGFVHYVWPVDAGLTITGLQFATYQAKAAQFVARPYTWYDDVELLPSATTDHQIVKQHNVLGSARTTGSIRIASPTASVPLGKVLVITTPTSALPAGFQPDGERWVTNGTTIADATALAGHYYTPSTSTYGSGSTFPVFDVPVSMLTAGAYQMVALVKVESLPLVAGVQAQLLVGSTLVGPTSASEVSLPSLATGWQFVPVGTVYLPPLPVQNADDTTKVRLTFKGAKLANVYMIPAWQVGGRAVADFSIVDCGLGTVAPGGASSSLFIDSPSIEQPQGGWWRGPTADRGNVQSAWPDALKPGTHVFTPGSLTNFVVSLGAAGPTSTLIYKAAHVGMATS